MLTKRRRRVVLQRWPKEPNTVGQISLQYHISYIQLYRFNPDLNEKMKKIYEEPFENLTLEERTIYLEGENDDTERTAQDDQTRDE